VDDGTSAFLPGSATDSYSIQVHISQSSLLIGHGLVAPVLMTAAPDSHRLLTVAEACAQLRISRPTFYALVRTGRLRTITIGRARRVPVSAIDQFVADAVDARSQQTRSDEK